MEKRAKKELLKKRLLARRMCVCVCVQCFLILSCPLVRFMSHVPCPESMLLRKRLKVFGILGENHIKKGFPPFYELFSGNKS